MVVQRRGLLVGALERFGGMGDGYSCRRMNLRIGRKRKRTEGRETRYRALNKLMVAINSV